MENTLSINKAGSRQKLLQESSQPSLAHQSRKAAVGVKQALPAGIQAPSPAPLQNTQMYSDTAAGIDSAALASILDLIQ